MEELLTPYEVTSGGHVFARLADIRHALKIVQLLEEEGYEWVFIMHEGISVWGGFSFELDSDQAIMHAYEIVLDRVLKHVR